MNPAATLTRLRDWAACAGESLRLLACVLVGLTDLRAQQRTLGLDCYPALHMNTQPSPLPSSIAHVSALRRILGLATRALSVFPECALSWSLVVQWCKEHILLQRRWSREALAIDDEEEEEVTHDAAGFGWSLERRQWVALPNSGRGQS